jgi:hypothetical protein
MHTYVDTYMQYIPLTSRETEGLTPGKNMNTSSRILRRVFW